MDDNNTRHAFIGEQQFNDGIINTVLMVSSVLAVMAVISSSVRAMEIGWTLRDLVQWILVTGLVTLALVRRIIDSRHKALFLIIMFTLGGFSGFYTLGMLGGTIFVFATALVVVAVFYSTRITWTYTVLCLMLSGIVAYRFCTGQVVMTSDAVTLITRSAHWLVYIICMGFFFAVTSVTIHTYHKAMKLLVDQIKQQRDEMIRMNDELIQAAQNVNVLSGLLPICSSCKKIRDDKGYWNILEAYIKEHSEADFTHGICPTCAETLYPDDFNKREA